MKATVTRLHVEGTNENNGRADFDKCSKNVCESRSLLRKTGEANYFHCVQCTRCADHESIYMTHIYTLEEVLERTAEPIQINAQHRHQV